MDFCRLPPYQRLASCMAGGTAVMPRRGQGPARGRAGLVSRAGMPAHDWAWPGQAVLPAGSPPPRC